MERPFLFLRPVAALPTKKVVYEAFKLLLCVAKQYRGDTEGR